MGKVTNMNGKRDSDSSGSLTDSGYLRFFRKQLLFWGGLTAIALAFFVYGTWGILPFPGDFSRNHLRSMLRPGTAGQLIVSVTFFFALLFTIESWFALRFISGCKKMPDYLSGFSCEILPRETPFEREGPAQSFYFITGIYGRSFLLSSPLHGDVFSIIGRDANKLLPSGRYTITIYEKRYSCHPQIPGWPLCLFLPAGNRPGIAPLPEDAGGEFVLLEGELDELWFLCLDRFPFAFPHRMRGRRPRKQWPGQLADLNTAVKQAEARAADAGKPVVVARKITTVSMYSDKEIKN